MGKVIEAKAVISAEDRTGKAFDSIKKHFAELGKGAKVSKDIGALGKQLDAATKGIRQIQEFRSTQGGFAQARGAFRQTQAEVARLAKQLDTARKTAAGFDGIRSFSKSSGIAQEMASARKQVADLERQLSSARRAVKGAATAFESQASAMKGAKHALDGSGISVGRLVAEENRLKAAISGVNDAYARQRSAAKAAGEQVRAARVQSKEHAELQHRIDRHGVGHAVAGAAAGYVSVHGITHGIADTIKAGARYQHEVVALQNAGRTPEEMREIDHASSATARELPTATFEENLKVINETTGAFGSLHHAIENLTFMQKSASALHASAGDKIHDNAGELGNKLARFFEMRGTAGDTHLFQKEAGEMIRAMIFTRGNFNPGEMVNFAQQAKASLPLYNERFLTKIAPSLVTEFGGDRAGTAANAFRGVIMGKANDKKQAEEWVKLGLLDQKMAIMKGGHAVSWKAGAVKDTNLALSDPLEWAEKILIPALKKSGVDVDDKLELSKGLGTLFRNSNSNLFAEALTQKLSRNRLHKDEENINKAGTLDEVYQRNLKEDPTEGLKALQAGLENLMTTVSSPLMLSAGAALKALAESLQGFAVTAKDHPVLATGAGVAAAGGALAGAGWMSYQLMNGFGLGASATALDGSAAALTAAAAELGGAGLLGKVPGGAAVKATGMLGKLGPIGFLGATGLGIGAIAAGVTFVDATLPNANRMNGYGAAYKKSIGLSSYPAGWGADGLDVSGGIGANASPFTTNRPKTWGEMFFGSTRGGAKDPTRMNLPVFGTGTKMMPGDPTPETQGPQRPEAVPLPPGRPSFSGDPGGIIASLNNTLDKATAASATAANGGKPIEATVKPDQITAKVSEIPPVTGEATVNLEPQRVIVELNSDLLTAKIAGEVGRQTAKIPLAASGARPGAVSMPGAAATPGAGAAPGAK